MSRTARSCAAALLLGAAAPAQLPADLQELAQQVETAHRTADAKAVTGFAADLRVQELARLATEHRGELELSVRFLEWTQPETGKPWPLIRYKQTDSARSVEQGRDRVDYWSCSDGKLQDMRSREMATDLEHCRRNLKLARQMLQFLDPTGLLRSLGTPSAVTDEDLVQGRNPKIACRVVAGTLPAFPLQRQGGDDGKVAVKVYVAKADHRLVGLAVTPLGDEDAPRTADGEFLLFAEHRLLAGRLVPMRVRHFAVDPKGERVLQLGVDLTRLDLEQEPVPADFDRPK